MNVVERGIALGLMMEPIVDWDPCHYDKGRGSVSSPSRPCLENAMVNIDGVPYCKAHAKAILDIVEGL